MSIEISKRADGLTIITDSIRDVSSVTLAIGVGVGSRNESKAENGISHFLEHMAFKGTKKRTAFDIANEVDSVGGVMNAFTSHEKTVYYIKLLAENVDLAMDILSDILQNSIFDESELERERGVILQELHSGKDTPDDVVFDHYGEKSFANQPLGRPIIGTEKNIKSFSRDDLLNYFHTKYTADNIVVSAAGNVSHSQIVDLTNKFLTSLNTNPKLGLQSATYTGGNYEKHKASLKQAQFCLGFAGPSYVDKDYYSAQIMCNILGGGMSSRLFQEVREKLGLCYTISCFLSAYKDAGTFTVYSGTTCESLAQLEETVRIELAKIAKSGASQDELTKTVNQYKTALLMSLESTSTRAQRAASNILSFGRYIPHEEIIQNVMNVKNDDIMEFASKMLRTQETRILYGKIK